MRAMQAYTAQRAERGSVEAAQELHAHEVQRGWDHEQVSPCFHCQLLLSKTSALAQLTLFDLGLLFLLSRIIETTGNYYTCHS